MYVTVGPRKIPVTVATDLRDDDDHATYGLFRPAGPDIALDVTTPGPERLGILVHEIGEAYDHYVGRNDPEHDEGRHNRTATIMEQLIKDLADQGSEIILHQLFGDDTLSASVNRLATSARHLIIAAASAPYRDAAGRRSGPISKSGMASSNQSHSGE